MFVHSRLTSWTGRSKGVVDFGTILFCLNHIGLVVTHSRQRHRCWTDHLEVFSRWCCLFKFDFVFLGSWLGLTYWSSCILFFEARNQRYQLPFHFQVTLLPQHHAISPSEGISTMSVLVPYKVSKYKLTQAYLQRHDAGCMDNAEQIRQVLLGSSLFPPRSQGECDKDLSMTSRLGLATKEWTIAVPWMEWSLRLLNVEEYAILFVLG